MWKIDRRAMKLSHRTPLGNLRNCCSAIENAVKSRKFPFRSSSSRFLSNRQVRCRTPSLARLRISKRHGPLSFSLRARSTNYSTTVLAMRTCVETLPRSLDQILYSINPNGKLPSSLNQEKRWGECRYAGLIPAYLLERTCPDLSDWVTDSL